MGNLNLGNTKNNIGILMVFQDKLSFSATKYNLRNSLLTVICYMLCDSGRKLDVHYRLLHKF